MSSMLRNKIVVGYELQAALKTMLLDDDVPKDNWRDTATARLIANAKNNFHWILESIEYQMQDLPCREPS